MQVEDVDADGLPKGNNKSKFDLDGGQGQVSLLIRLSHRVCSLPCISAYLYAALLLCCNASQCK